LALTRLEVETEGAEGSGQGVAGDNTTPIDIAARPAIMS
jgi:hypothetical protein